MVEQQNILSAANKDNKADKSCEQYLTFVLGVDEYGVDILAVQEIHGWVEPRPIPNTPEFVKGVIEWRGTIVPIVDLRLRFSYPDAEYSKTTVVIILQTQIDELAEPIIVGVVVDAVSEVHEINSSQLKKAPGLGSKVDTRYIKGLASIEQSMIVLLELKKLINLDELDSSA